MPISFGMKPPDINLYLHKLNHSFIDCLYFLIL